MREHVAEHFEDLAKQAHAARLGMWVFLGSEVLFFSGLFGLYTTCRVQHPDGFALGVRHNTLMWGSINTGVLLLSSFIVALAVHALRIGRRRLCAVLIAATIALGGVFLAIKIHEYFIHFGEGIYPGGSGSFFQEHGQGGVAMFFTLYYFMTGLHALHVTVGMGVLTFLLVQVTRGRVLTEAPHPLEIGAIYWHLVDIVWIFLWPLFYLGSGGPVS